MSNKIKYLIKILGLIGIVFYIYNEYGFNLKKIDHDERVIGGSDSELISELTKMIKPYQIVEVLNMDRGGRQSKGAVVFIPKDSTSLIIIDHVIKNAIQLGYIYNGALCKGLGGINIDSTLDPTGRTMLVIWDSPSYGCIK